MPVEGEILFKSRDEVYAELVSQFQLLVPDVYLGPDGNLNLLFQVMAGVMESMFLANQVVSEDMFVSTSNEGALERWGEQYGVPRKFGTVSSGTLKFFGQGGTFIPIGTEVAYDPGTGDLVIYFKTTVDSVIPNPGIPTAPTLTDQAAGNITGAIEYAVSFVTANGETLPGAISTPLTVTARTIRLTNIPLGGVGTLSRKIYRQKDGNAQWKLVTTIANNTTTQYDDNVLEASLGVPPITVSTAEAAEVAAQSEMPGYNTNLGIGTISVLTNAPDGLTSVFNITLFAGGTDSEGSFDYRQRLLRTIRAPSTGSADDLKAWSEEINGVETATVFTNDNLGVVQNGHATVRLVSTNSSQPPAALVAAVQADLQAKDIANIEIHVAGFTAVVTNVTVDVLLEEGFILNDVTTSVQLAISDYINALDVGEAARAAGFIAAVFNLPGIADVTTSVPAEGLPTSIIEKRIPGTITVT